MNFVVLSPKVKCNLDGYILVGEFLLFGAVANKIFFESSLSMSSGCVTFPVGSCALVVGGRGSSPSVSSLYLMLRSFSDWPSL